MRWAVEIGMSSVDARAQCPLSDNSGQRWILDRDGLSAANDAKRTLLLAGLRGTWYPVEAEARVDQGRDSLVYVTVCAVLRYV
jgi:hypothetical protein